MDWISGRQRPSRLIEIQIRFLLLNGRGNFQAENVQRRWEIKTRMNVSTITITMIMNGAPAADNDIAEKRYVFAYRKSGTFP